MALLVGGGTLKEKPPKVIRIILTGGSGMRGNIQSWSIIKMFGYPEGTYDYPTSIAGKLKHQLELKYPNQNFEVINAAVVRHLFAQSYAGYYEKLHDFNPDIIINMDGYNDDALANDFNDGGNPYLLTAEQANEGIELETLRRSYRWGYTCMLLNHILLSDDIQQGPSKSLTTVFHNISAADALRMAKEIKRDSINTAFSIIPDSFRLLDPYMEKNMQKQLWLISSYENQLKHDGVYSIFCYQPELIRKGAQKKLSFKEEKMLEYLNTTDDYGDKPLPLLAYDSVFMKYVQGYSPDLIHAANNTGASKYYIRSYYHKYFINNYISPAIDSIAKLYGGDYVDIGQQMMGISDSVEFYVDYTHTTPYGNEFIAKIMAERVEKYLDSISIIKKTVQHR